jgi:hypothetical protein
MNASAANRRVPRCGRDARAPRECPANPASGETPGLGRGARRATGDQAYPSHQSARPKTRARRPRSQGAPRQSRIWRGAGIWALSQAHRASDYWSLPEPCSRGLDEGAIRSPQGDGEPCLSPASPQCAPRCGRGRPRSQGGPLPVPRLEMRSSSSAEPAGRRGAVPMGSLPAMRPQDAGEDARAPRGGPALMRRGTMLGWGSALPGACRRHAA